MTDLAEQLNYDALLQDYFEKAALREQKVKELAEAKRLQSEAVKALYEGTKKKHHIIDGKKLTITFRGGVWFFKIPRGAGVKAEPTGEDE